MFPNVTKTSKKRVEKYECKKCDYETSYKYNWERHIMTRKHKMITNDNKNESKRVKKSEYVCECGKNYKFLSGLSRHKKQCFYIEELSEYENKILEKEKEDEAKSERFFLIYILIAIAFFVVVVATIFAYIF